MAELSRSFPVETADDVKKLTTDLSAALLTALRESLDVVIVRKPFQPSA